jgi:hypothetical protein
VHRKTKAMGSKKGKPPLVSPSFASLNFVKFAPGKAENNI